MTRIRLSARVFPSRYCQKSPISPRHLGRRNTLVNIRLVASVPLTLHTDAQLQWYGKSLPTSVTLCHCRLAFRRVCHGAQKTLEKSLMFFPLWKRHHHVGDPLQSIEEEADEDHEFHRHGFLPNWALANFLAGKNGKIGLLIIFFVLICGSFSLRQNNLILLSWGRLVLVCSMPNSNYYHTSAFRPKWRCMNGLLVQLCQDVCKFGRPIRCYSANL